MELSKQERSVLGLLKALGPSKEQRADRYDLAKRLGIGERDVRYIIESLREKGVPVCATSGKKGYWLGTAADLEVLEREYRAKGKNELYKASLIGRMRERMEQGRLF